MFKKLLKVGVVACILAASTTAISAQTESSCEYPSYGFWSNWSIGIAADIDWQLGQEKAYGFGNSYSVGGALLFERDLNYVWDYRLKIAYPGAFQADTTNECSFSRYGLFTMGVKFSINNAILGFNPERKGNFYLLADAGLAIWNTKVRHTAGITHAPYSRILIVGELGLGYSYDVSEHSTLFIEGIFADQAFAPNIFKGQHKNYDITLNLGYMYNFGLTEEDARLQEEFCQLTRENLESLNAQVSDLQRENSALKQNEDRLRRQISDLENTKPEPQTVQADNSKASKELQDKINQLKADQLTYYALPFSVLFATGSYNVSDNEMTKVAAIAKVIKNTDADFVVFGACDYTGSDEVNMKLSEQRAKEVKRLLVEKYGVPEGRLNTVWNGKRTVFGDEKYSINRRVSFYRVIGTVDEFRNNVK